MTISTMKKDQILWSNQPGLEGIDLSKPFNAVMNGDIHLGFEPVARTFNRKDGSVVRAAKVTKASTGREAWTKLDYGTALEIVTDQ